MLTGNSMTITSPFCPKTSALLLRATKSIWHSHRIVVMDAAFTGIPVLAFLLQKGVYGVAPLKPKGSSYSRASDALALKNACDGLQVGEFKSRKGTYQCPPLSGDGPPASVTLFQFALRMPQYPFMMLATTGDLQRSRRIRTVYVVGARKALRLMLSRHGSSVIRGQLRPRMQWLTLRCPSSVHLAQV